MKQIALSIAFAVALLGIIAEAHHSIAGVYDVAKQTRIEGIVTDFQFVNPHPFVTVEVRSTDNTSEQWRLEMDNRRELVQIGLTEQTFKRGDRVLVSGSPGRANARSLYIRTLDRPADGFKYEQVGGTPRVRSAR